MIDELVRWWCNLSDDKKALYAYMAGIAFGIACWTYLGWLIL